MSVSGIPGWSDRVAALLAPVMDRGAVPGRVARDDGPSCRVVTPAGERRGVSGRQVTVGDWVALEGDDIVEVAPRWSVLTRRDPRRDAPQLLAANVDVVFVVSPLYPPTNARRLERMLAIAWESGATPAVVLTKPDRCDDLDAAVAAVAQIALGVEIRVASGLTGEGIGGLRGALAGGLTGVLLGSSGAGKSTLVNALLGEARFDTAEVRESDGRGRHTTTSRQLVALPGGGVVIDTPGIRALGLWDAADGVAATFSDIETLANSCRFR
ncbi:MAG: ribosome small subunit-dependent GTPase A, partial [Actinobacteria bacterium]|nr:ribosome small subunit-dependent GTPase A [Actinomycetota bacterium]